MPRVLSFILALMLSGASLAEIRVADELGEVVLQSPPERVVALEFSFVDALATLGVSPVGVADDGDANRVIEPIRAQLNDWTSLGSRSQPSLEVIASLEPDLIIADVERHAAIYEDLQRIAPTLILKSRGETYEDNLNAVIKVAQAFDQEQTMVDRIAQHNATMDAYAARVDSNATVQFAISSEKGVWLHGPRAYAGGVIARLGLNSPIPEETEQAYLQITLERLVQANPDYFLVGEYGEQTAVDTYKHNPLWSVITAVKNDQYVETDPRLWSLNRGMISAEIMAEELVDLLSTTTAAR
ncbi:Fe(3+) dicitrate ABC transporter substrate-binding protein [Saccharospirillum impatiens]|uniref:Fe(3+) dicitrate ABC transporter substrate-binding protein n=1 Tax=Saccharospirillum impatiens TaxID=169438 RepID=UPI00040C01B0|nr:Fe(3+) dicitrate ABC transporter substrate-binding protein [Saccharospirillum impatiens]